MFSSLYWASFSDFIYMGGYGLYVWGSFLACVLGLGMEWLLIRQQRKQVIQPARAVMAWFHCFPSCLLWLATRRAGETRRFRCFLY